MTNTYRIAQMALEAGFPSMSVDNLSDADRARLTAFASLVAEDCAKVCEGEPERQRGDGVFASDQQACAQAIRARYSKP